MAPVISAALPHGQKRRTLHGLPVAEDMGQVMIQHLPQMMKVPAD